MAQAVQLLAVIPLYNHGEAVRAVVEKTLAVHEQVLVLDDGSTDGGAETLAGLPIRMLRHDGNRGKGAAIMTAAREARRLGMTHIATIDADGQHEPADLPRLLAICKEMPRAVLVGTRNFDAADVPGASRFGRRFSNFWLQLQTGQSLGDTQSGFRIYPLEVLEALALREVHYSFEIEVLVRAAWAGVELREAPIAVYYPPAGERITHFRRFTDNFRLTVLNTRFTLRAMIPWPHRKIMAAAAEADKLSVWHPLQSLRLLLTENATPGRLAGAGALGVVLGAAPLIAFHTIAIILAAGFLRLNRVAAVSTSQLCMPPLVPALCIETGYFLRHGEFLTEVSLETLGYQGLERLWEWLLGSLIVGPVLALAVAAAVYIMAQLLARRAGLNPAGEHNAGRERGWSSRSIGAPWQHRFFYGLIRLGGRRVAYAMLHPVVLYYMLLRPDQRRKSESYLRRRFPGATGRQLLRHSYRMSLALGKSLIDRAVVGIVGPSSTRLTLEGGEDLLALLGEGKGLILVTAHVGSWQTAMVALDFLKQPVNLLMQREEGDIDRHYFEHGGGDCHFRVIDPRGHLGGTLEILEVLKRGEVLSVMGDRLLGSDRSGVAVDFLGGAVRFPISAYVLAAATGAPIGVLLSAKTGADRYELRLARVIRVPAGLKRGSPEVVSQVRQFVEALEDYTQQHPYQFFNFYDMWDTDPGDGLIGSTNNKE